MAHTICMAGVFMIASAVAQANQCSSGGECPSDDMPKSVTSLLQTKLQMEALEESLYGVADESSLPEKLIPTDGSEQNAADQQWGPEVQKYIQDLESLERGRSLLLDKVVDPSANIVGETLFVVVSDSMHYTENLKWISDSWGKDLSSSQLLAIGDATNVNLTRMHVEPTVCPAHSINGACCKGAQAIITAHHELEKQPKLKWAFITEDDAYVRPEAVDKRLKRVDSVGATSRGTLIALEGCQSPTCVNGVCGNGGIALSREALMNMVGDRPSKYLKDHMQSCNACGLRRGDEAIGTQAYAHNITIIKQSYGPRNAHTPTTMGMYGRLVPKKDFDSTLNSDIEPLLYHPMKRRGMFNFLDQLFAKQHESVEDPHGEYCATYNGNTACTSVIEDVPWGHYWEDQAAAAAR